MEPSPLNDQHPSTYTGGAPIHSEATTNVTEKAVNHHQSAATDINANNRNVSTYRKVRAHVVRHKWLYIVLTVGVVLLAVLLPVV